MYRRALNSIVHWNWALSRLESWVSPWINARAVSPLQQQRATVALSIAHTHTRAHIISTHLKLFDNLSVDPGSVFVFASQWFGVIYILATQIQFFKHQAPPSFQTSASNGKHSVICIGKVTDNSRRGWKPDSSSSLSDSVNAVCIWEQSTAVRDALSDLWKQNWLTYHLEMSIFSTEIHVSLLIISRCFHQSSSNWSVWLV